MLYDSFIYLGLTSPPSNAHDTSNGASSSFLVVVKQQQQHPPPPPDIIPPARPPCRFGGDVCDPNEVTYGLGYTYDTGTTVFCWTCDEPSRRDCALDQASCANPAQPFAPTNAPSARPTASRPPTLAGACAGISCGDDDKFFDCVECVAFACYLFLIFNQLLLARSDSSASRSRAVLFCSSRPPKCQCDAIIYWAARAKKCVSPLPAGTTSLAMPDDTPPPTATAVPSPAPTATTIPIPAPTHLPNPVPTAAPVPAPSAVPVPAPSAVPIPAPSAVPIPAPSAVPIPAPSAVPIPAPTSVPIPAPTSVPAGDDGGGAPAERRRLAWEDITTTWALWELLTYEHVNVTDAALAYADEIAAQAASDHDGCACGVNWHGAACALARRSAAPAQHACAAADGRQCDVYRDGATAADARVCVGPAEEWGAPCYPPDDGCTDATCVANQGCNGDRTPLACNTSALAVAEAHCDDAIEVLSS